MDKEAYLKIKKIADDNIKNEIVDIFYGRKVPVEDGVKILGELQEDIVEKNKQN